MLLLPPYPYPLGFHELLQDPSASHSRDLAQATTARAKLRSTVQRARKEPSEGDWVACDRVSPPLSASFCSVAEEFAPLQAALDYLAYLYAILSCVESDDLLLATEPGQSNSRSKGAKLTQCNYSVCLEIDSLHHCASQKISSKDHVAISVRLADSARILATDKVFPL